MITTEFKITCFIEYKLDPSKVDLFNQYAQHWGDIIPACGGNLIGYFLPHEGTNNIAYGLIAFKSLAAYEAYRVHLKESAAGRNNFLFANTEKFILEEKRTFLHSVPKTLWQLSSKLQEQQP